MTTYCDCGIVEKVKLSKINFIGLVKPEHNQDITFEELFNDSLTEQTCLVCEAHGTHSLLKNIEKYRFNTNFKFLIVKINLNYIRNDTSVRYTSNIVNFDPDHINIKNSSGAVNGFFLKCSIMHHANDNNNLSSGGHYTAWIRTSTNNWVHISDANGTYHKNLPKT